MPANKLLFGAYARVSRVKKIAYNPDEKDSSPIYLPKLYFQLTESQKRVLEYLEAGNFSTLMELSEKVDQSRAMLYRNIKELEEMGLVEDLNLRLDPRGNIQTDDNYMSSKKGVFSAGDMRRGQSLIVWAISEGRRCARAIDEYLMGESRLPII